jgi:hypothetical protein
MTAVVLYSSIPGVGHQGAARVELESRSFLRSGLFCLGGGNPNATMPGRRVQIGVSLPGGNPFETYIFNLKSAVSTAWPVSKTKRIGLQGRSSASSIRALTDLAVLADCRGVCRPARILRALCGRKGASLTEMPRQSRLLAYTS